MINCAMKLLGISLTHGYNSFSTWSILVVPLVLCLVFLAIWGISGARGYHSVGKIHAAGGWILVVGTVLCYVSIALWSDSIRNEWKLRVVHNVQDKTAGADTRRLAMIVESANTMERVSAAMDAEKTVALLRAIQEQIKETGDEETSQTFEAAIGEYLDSVPGVKAKIMELVKAGAVLLDAAFRNLKEDDIKNLLIATIQTGDLKTSISQAMKNWFLLEDKDSKRPLEEACFFIKGNPVESDAREIAYRTGYGTKALPTIRFFVRAKEWFRGLLWCLVTVVIGFCFVSRGERIKRSAKRFERSEDSIRQRTMQTV